MKKNKIHDISDFASTLARVRWAKMSPEERRKATEKMREKFNRLTPEEKSKEMSRRRNKV